MDEPVGIWLLLLAGRSPDEQHALLAGLGCLSRQGQANRMAVIRLLDRVYQSTVGRGYRPPPIQPDGENLGDLWRRLPLPFGNEPSAETVVRLQYEALGRAGYLELDACVVEQDAVEAWWASVLPKVTAIRAEHDPIYAAIAQIKTKPGQRNDPITCPLCGRPAPRGATYCVWCGRWLAAPHI